jgi:hypothetical protein
MTSKKVGKKYYQLEGRDASRPISGTRSVPLPDAHKGKAIPKSPLQVTRSDEVETQSRSERDRWTFSQMPCALRSALGNLETNEILNRNQSGE